MNAVTLLEPYRDLLWLTVLFAGLALITVWLIVPNTTGTYGRHVDPKAPTNRWTDVFPKIKPTWGWFFMEIPSVVWFAYVFQLGDFCSQPIPFFLFVLWEFHYVERSMIYPLKKDKSSEKRTFNSLMAIFGMIFNGFNSYLNASHLSTVHVYPPTWVYNPQFCVGVALYFVGYYINRWADDVLVALRKQKVDQDSNEEVFISKHGSVYRIPRGGLYNYITCPNYFGETLEWLGFAMAADSPAALLFVFFTAANLFTRAQIHHQWYHDTFKTYPKDKKAVVPFLF